MIVESNAYRQKKKLFSYSVRRYVLSIFSIAIFSIICFTIFGNKHSPLSSFIWSVIAFFFITVFASVALLKNSKWISFFILAYFIKIGLGLLHYLYFIDPQYFKGDGSYSALSYEYEGVFNQICIFAYDKIQHGIWFFKPYIGGVSHQEILSFISIPFIYFGDYPLTIASINAFSSLVISMNIMLIAIYKLQVNRVTLKYIAFITAYFPMTLISSLLYRDIVGMTLMSVGLVMIFFAKNHITQYLMLAVAMYLFYMQRTVYPLVLLMAFLINSTINNNYKSKERNLFFKVLTIIVVALLFPIVYNMVNTEANVGYSRGIFNFNLLILPVKLIIGLIGPFPWNQFLMYETVSAYAYQLQDYLQGTLHIAIIIAIFINRKKYFQRSNFNLLNITGILLILTGLFNSLMHMPYVAIGFIFLIPWLFTHINFFRLFKMYIYSFMALLLLNFVFISLVGHLGISFLWK